MFRANRTCHDRRTRLVLGLTIFAALAGCGSDMADQPRYEAYEPSSLFPDGMSSRPLVYGTVARGSLSLETGAFETGRSDGELLTEFPIPLTRKLLDRGQRRYTIFCTPCHDGLGRGQGMVVRAGYPVPPSLHIERLRTAAVGHLYEVVRYGLGAMPSYGEQIPVRDRWAIVGYVRAMQLSQNVEPDRLTPEEQLQLKTPEPR